MILKSEECGRGRGGSSSLSCGETCPKPHAVSFRPTVSVFAPCAWPLELRIKRQNSSDSISSLNSITSHSSIGSSKEADAKKKKKKSWVGEGLGEPRGTLGDHTTSAREPAFQNSPR